MGFKYLLTVIDRLSGLGRDNEISTLSETDTRAEVWNGLIPSINYSSIDHLVSTINKTASSGNKNVVFSYDPVKNRTSLKLRSEVSLIISEKLSDILGFNGVTNLNIVESPSHPSLQSLRRTFWVEGIICLSMQTLISLK